MTSDKYYKMTREQVVGGIHSCLINVRHLLKAVESLISKNCDSSIALGLYTFAIEEFGKAIHLKSCIKRMKKEYDVPKRIFSDHDYKFNRALAMLPMESKSAVRGIKIDVNKNPKSQIVKLSSSEKDKITIPPYTTGFFSLIDNSEIDFEARLSCFYVDWDCKTNNWKIQPMILAEGITRGIFKFNQYITKWEKTIK